MPLKVFSMIVFIFFAVIFAVCLLEALFPKWCWETFESWKATKEPSKAYFLMKRISGIIGMIIIAVIALSPTLIAYFNK